MANNFWQDVWGGAQNMVASGKVYDRRTNTYAPQGVRVPRTIAGIAGQLNPVVGLVGGQLANRLPAGSTAWEQRLKAPEGVVQQFDAADASRDGLLQDWARQQLSGTGGSPGVSVGSPQYLPQGYGTQTPSVGGLFDRYMNNNVQQATDNLNSRMDTEMQSIQDRINAQGGVATMPAVQARGIGGHLGFGGGGHYNNGVGAGTGFGAANYTNDGWGDVASGFGVGGMTGGSRDQAMSSYGPTGRKTRV